MATGELEYIAGLEDLYQRVAPTVKGADDESAVVRRRIALALFFYDQLKELCEEYAKLPPGALNAEQNAVIAGVFAKWISATSTFINDYALHSASSRFSTLPGVPALLEAYKDVSLMSMPSERVQRSFASLNSGRGMSFEEAMNVLRDELR